MTKKWIVVDEADTIAYYDTTLAKARAWCEKNGDELQGEIAIAEVKVKGCRETAITWKVVK